MENLENSSPKNTETAEKLKCLEEDTSLNITDSSALDTTREVDVENQTPMLCKTIDEAYEKIEGQNRFIPYYALVMF